MKVLVIGGVAAGPKIAAKIIRIAPDTDVTIVERGVFLSYAGCGLPYYISGEIKDQKELMCTATGAVRDPVFFQKVKNVKVLNRTEAVRIDRAKKQVEVKSLETGEIQWLPYDKLVLATGATPIRPPIPGIDLPNVFTLHGVHDAEGIKAFLAKQKARDVVIIGGGLIGVETTEALDSHGCRVTMVEMQPHILGMLDAEMARLVEKHMEARGVKVMTNTQALAFEGHVGGSQAVAQVRTTRGVLPAELVIVAIGVRPEVKLAREAGLEIGEKTRAIRVNPRLQTSDPDIFAAGDCVESVDLVTGQPCYVPLGSTANKQGRVAAVNICGGHEEFRGVLGTSICKVFEFCVGKSGLTEKAARQQGYDVITAMAPGPDRAHYMTAARPLLMKIVADRATGRLLGIQTTGPGDGAKRIDIAATAITAKMTLDDLANLDLAYAPPYAPAMDNLITAVNVARNKRDGWMEGISADEVHRKMQAGESFVLLDVRSPQEYEEVRLAGSTLIPLGALRGRLQELPRDREIVAFCKVSLRGYEAALILKHAGFTAVKVLDGGIAMWPYDTLTGKS